MLGKCLISLFILVSGLAGQSFRYTVVCEVENAPNAEMADQMKRSCEGNVFIQGGKSLLQKKEQSFLTLITQDGGFESLLIDHTRKEWMKMPGIEAAKELVKSPMSEMGVRLRTEVRSLNPDRVIEGHNAKGVELSISADFSKSKLSDAAASFPKISTTLEIWIASELKSADMAELKVARGVGARSTWIEDMIQVFSAMFDGGAEAMARLNELPPGLTLEASVRSSSPNGGKDLIMRMRSINISQTEIAPQVFAIPEGYRRVE